KQISWVNFLKAKFYTLLIINIIPLISILLLLLFKGHSDLWSVTIIATVYNIGMIPLLTLFFANFNYQKIDINNKTIFGGWQGMRDTQLLLLIPYAAPIAVVSLLSEQFYVILFCIGILSVLFMNNWLKYYSKMLESRKYKMAAGFMAMPD